MHLQKLSCLKDVLRSGSEMLKRVHSHIKARKPAFLEVGLTANQRSKSLTQIDCLDTAKTDVIGSDMNSKTEMTLSSDHFVVTLEMVGEDEKERLPALSGVRLR
ncbi:uncharacterized protein LOC143230273 [Tachypleus tridentatus]|uniref:uncharacterized protein LOC143230273 n=1 Tax=Tachypleus tridentatus TaxID=6853 RepID=UPI003FD29FBC